ncbi:hypothetical protein EJ05DRAFT_501497 [Pseudovirgaria hyperparasitica]|uniref:Uncharacterized protein n=1 Tax=Pseudovirgaria hyperparasitica TaxID=470096 RepID=A0A6A6W321_9PEZI|nr:uncharacterized protein EJ05DRAFT_501497 [Pseudovirgaria hyperparasitica]KAF2756955.1 hypothetical protein EJ05DRAFT_501497 [Pseudovirgaria hyperparasitica]
MSTQLQHHSQDHTMSNRVPTPQLQYVVPYERSDSGYCSRYATPERDSTTSPTPDGQSFEQIVRGSDAVSRFTYTKPRHTLPQQAMPRSHYQPPVQLDPQDMTMHPQQWSIPFSQQPNSHAKLSDPAIDPQILGDSYQLLHDSPQEQYAELPQQQHQQYAELPQHHQYGAYPAPQDSQWLPSHMDDLSNVRTYHGQDSRTSYEQPYPGLYSELPPPYDQQTNYMSANVNHRMYHPPYHHQKQSIAHDPDNEEDEAEAEDTPETRILKPQKSKHQPWVRVNGKTQGGNRTKKINAYKQAQKYMHDQYIPAKNKQLNAWTSSHGFEFTYNQYGELAQPTLSIDQIRDFLYDHPWRHQARRMTLWIQKVAADSARRYPTRESDHCRFADCPSQVKGKGTMLHGHYRVAFDEHWNSHGEAADPFLVAGFVHLDCLERFLDLPDLCRTLDVRADGRLKLRNEPKAKYRAAFDHTDKATHAEALSFLETIKSNTNNPPSYPGPIPLPLYRTSWSWPHELARHTHTLTARLSAAKLAHDRPRAQISQFEKRLDADRADRVAAGLDPHSNADFSNCLLHQGSIWLYQEAQEVRRAEEGDVRLGRVRQARRDRENAGRGGKKGVDEVDVPTTPEDDDTDTDTDDEEEEEEEQTTSDPPTRSLRSAAGLRATQKSYSEPDEDDIDGVSAESGDGIDDKVGSVGQQVRKRRLAAVDEVEDADSDEEFDPRACLGGGRGGKRRRGGR